MKKLSACFLVLAMLLAGQLFGAGRLSLAMPVSAAEIEAPAPAPLEAGKLKVAVLTGTTLYAYGPGVRGGEGGVYTVEAGSRVRVVAVNESREFKNFVHTGITSPAISDNAMEFTMPAGGAAISCELLPLGSNLLATHGRAFSTAYTIDDTADLKALEAIAARNSDFSAAMDAHYQRFGFSKASSANRNALMNGYFKVTGNISAPSGFLGIGNNSANAFKGYIDGSYSYFGDVRTSTITIPPNNANSSEYNGLFGYIGRSGGFALIRNLNVGGEFTSKGATQNAVYGGFAGSAVNTLIISVNSNIKITATDNLQDISVGGIVGSAVNVYIKDSKVLGAQLLQATGRDGLTTGAAAAGAVAGTAADSIFYNISAQLGNSDIKARSGAQSYAGGLIGRAESASSTFGLTIRDCNVESLAGTGIKSITAESKTGTAAAGGLFGYLSASNSAFITKIENSKINLAVTSELRISAKDTAAGDRAGLFAGGIAGAFGSNSVLGKPPEAPASVSGRPAIAITGQNGQSTGTISLFGGRVSVTAIAEGAASHVAAGGISGYNICDIFGQAPGRTNYLIENVTVTSRQGAASPAGASLSAAGGIVGFAQAGLAGENINVELRNTAIKAERSPGSLLGGTNADSIAAGGFAGSLGLSSASQIENIKIDLVNSSVVVSQLSQSSKLGRVAAGGLAGVFDGAGADATGIEVAVRGGSQISVTTATGPSQNRAAESFGAGGIVGYSAGAGIKNSSFTGDYSATGQRSVALTATQAVGASGAGGIIGFSKNAAISGSSVKNAYIFGEAGNNATAITGANVMAGGIAGVAADGARLLLNCEVQGSKIEASSPSFAAASAGGIAGAVFGASGSATASPNIDNSLVRGCEIVSSGAKRWAAAGGILGYSIDSALYISNSAVIDSKLYAASSGDQTISVNQTGALVTNEALSIAGGIAGKTGSAQTAATTLYNCYSNAEITLVNPDSEKIYRGGLVGYKLISADNLLTNSFFDLKKAGTDKAVDLASKTGFTMPAGVPAPADFKQYNAPDTDKGALNTASADKEVFEGAALDFGMVNLYNPGMASSLIFPRLVPGGEPTAPFAVAYSSVISSSTSDIVISQNNNPTDPAFGTTIALTPGAQVGKTVNMVMSVNLGGSAYAFGTKPVYIGVRPTVTAIDIYADYDGHPNAKLTPSPAEIVLAAGAGTLTLTADTIFQNDPTILPGDNNVSWEISDTAGFAAVSPIGAIQSVCTATVIGNVLRIDHNLALSDEKIVYIRAKDYAQNVYSTVVRLVVTPGFVTGVRINEALGSNSKTNPHKFSKTAASATLTANVLPINASQKGYTFEAYPLDSSGNPDLRLSARLTGVKPNGEILVEELTSADGLNQGDVFVVYAITAGRAGPGAILDLDCTLYGNMGFTPAVAENEERKVVSKPFFIALENDIITYKIGGGKPYSLTQAAVAGESFTFSTQPLAGRASIPSIAAYKLGAGGEQVYFTSSQIKTTMKDGVPVTEFTMTIPNSLPSEITMTVTYFESFTIRYNIIKSDGTVEEVYKSENRPMFIREEDILSEEELIDKSGDSQLLRGYTLAGWYKNSVKTGEATLTADYGPGLEPTEIEYTDSSKTDFLYEVGHVKLKRNEFTSSVGAGDVVDVYARLQYDVSISGSALLSRFECDNYDQAETKESNKNAPVNNLSDYRLRVEAPDDYFGSPRVVITVGGIELGEDKYEVSGSIITIPKEELTKAKLTQSGVSTDGIRITALDTNLSAAAGISEGPGQAYGVKIPRDGYATFIYNVNHATRTVVDAGGEPETRNTYGFANPELQNNLHLRFSQALPEGTVIEVRRVFAGTPRGIFWTEVGEGGKSEFSLSNDFFNMGDKIDEANANKVPLQRFGDYLEGSSALERYFIIIKPPVYMPDSGTGLLPSGSLRLTAGFNGTGNSSAASATLLTTAAAKPQLEVDDNDRRITYSLSAVESGVDDFRHSSTAFGISIYFIDEYGKELALADGTQIKFTSSSGSYATPVSSAAKPVSRLNFAAASGTYTVPEGANAPAGAVSLVIELIEAPFKPVNFFDIASAEEGEANYVKLAGGQVRVRKEYTPR